MFLNLSEWREFLETSGPGLAFIILCSVGSIVMLWGAAKERQGLVLIGLLLGGLAIPTIMIDWNIFNGIMALLLFLILIASTMVYSSMSAVKKREEQGGGPAVEYTKINEDGSTDTHLIGKTAYGKGHVQAGGHKPERIVETDRTAG
ncbi:hypothetical protein GWQ43_19870 (plasmid) [Alcaligenes faecalis]|uniref:hypothetical protein n=1 Tax=Alcaligenes faecalis TaxID=511 RepID=UPI00137BC1DB|nr:hypothetical protein [Alcaligenes faecalis]QHS38427.1 hypothetical protein GWQ43_19870 [Alcaligenes faecalis]